MIVGARASRAPHLIYTSVLGADRPRGLGILDAKVEIERMIEASGLPYSILRCGTYMEDIFDPNLKRLDEGTFFLPVFPVRKDRRFSCMSQRDVPRFVVEELLTKSNVLNRAFNFVAPGTWSVRDVEGALSGASGPEIKAPAKFPTFYLFPDFQMTTLEADLCGLWPERAVARAEAGSRGKKAGSLTFTNTSGFTSPRAPRILATSVRPRPASAQGHPSRILVSRPIHHA